MTLLSVKNLKKYFPVYAGVLRHEVGQVKAVDGLEYAIAEGEVLGLVGESGCGKSTAARASIRLIEPTEGEIQWQGESILAYDKKRLKQFRQEVQIVFQDPYASLNPRKSIGESVGEGLRYHGLVSGSELEDRVVHALERVGLSADAMGRYPHQFSGGQQQRICIGRAIIMQPRMIVCDEAVSALDVSVQAQILNLLSELKEEMGLSYLFISHDLSVIRHISDRVIVMRRGKMVERGGVREIFESPKEVYTKELLAAIPKSRP